MDFEGIENEIIEALDDLSNDKIEVIPMPESEADFVRDFEDARITVAFNGLKSDNPVTMREVAQDDRHTVAIVIQSRRLRGDSGAYSLYKRIRAKIAGFSCTGCEPFISRSFDLISDENDLFTWLALFECSEMQVPETDYEPQLIPVIKQIETNVNINQN